MTINDRVSHLIIKLNIRQKDFAKKLKLKPNTLSMIKNNKRNVTDRVINDICREFNVNENWLRNGEGNIFSDYKSSALSDLEIQYNLNEFDKDFIRNYLNSSREFRELLKDFINSFGKQSL